MKNTLIIMGINALEMVVVVALTLGATELTVRGLEFAGVAISGWATPLIAFVFVVAFIAAMSFAWRMAAKKVGLVKQ